MTDRASLTAEYMALFRALETSRPSSSRLFVDRDARLFLTGWRKWLYRMSKMPLGRRVVERVLDQASPGARGAGVARTKWIDDEAATALATATQLVLLGAGFDMRALRLPHAAHVDAFELDHPRTSVAKRARLGKVRTMPERIRYIGIDFNRQSLAEVLPRAGFDTSRPACWIWEGVTNYLAPASVDWTLRQIAETASEGSVLLFTYIDRAVLDSPKRYFGAVKLIARLQSYGEPWTFGLDPEEVRAYVAERGFRLLKDVSAAEICERAGRSTVETHGYEFYRMASVRVGS